MALTLNEEKRLLEILELAEESPDKLSDWEKGFLWGNAESKDKGYKSIKENYEEYGPNMRISDRQWASLTKLHEKLGGDELSDA